MEYLTRADIAKRLKISTKQAGRLMAQMPTIAVGATHKRVDSRDFEAWLDRQKAASAPPASHGNEKHNRHRGAHVGSNSIVERVHARIEKAAEGEGITPEQYAARHGVHYPIARKVRPLPPLGSRR